MDSFNTSSAYLVYIASKKCYPPLEIQINQALVGGGRKREKKETETERGRKGKGIDTCNYLQRTVEQGIK